MERPTLVTHKSCSSASALSANSCHPPCVRPSALGLHWAKQSTVLALALPTMLLSRLLRYVALEMHAHHPLPHFYRHETVRRSHAKKRSPHVFANGRIAGLGGPSGISF